MATDQTHPDPEVADVQARLMRMLDAVRLERVQAPEPEEGPKESDCPHCGSRAPWGASNWCPECGYYPKLGRAVSAEERDAVEQQELSARQLANAWRKRLAAGIVVVLLVSLGAAWGLRGAPQRGAWALAQLLLGAAVFTLGHVRAYLVASQQTDAITLSSLFVHPIQLWTAAVRRLPDSRGILYAGSWGLTASLLAVCVVGLDYGSLFGGGSAQGRNPMQTVLGLAGGLCGQGRTCSPAADASDMAAGGGSAPMKSLVASPSASAGRSMESAISEFAGNSGATTLAAAGAVDNSQEIELESSLTEVDTAAPIAADMRLSRPLAPSAAALSIAGSPHAPSASSAEAASLPAASVPRTPNGEARLDRGEFVIFGYLVNAEGEMRSVLLAETVEMRGGFVCKLPLDELTAAQRKELQETLDGVRTVHPALPSPYRARWVRPIIRCRVAYLGRTPEGWLKDGYLIDFDSVNAVPRERTTATAGRPAR